MKNITKVLFLLSFVLISFFVFKNVNADYIISDTSTLKSGGGSSVLVIDASNRWTIRPWKTQNASWIWNVADLSKEKALSGETEIFSKSFSLLEVPSSAIIHYYYDNLIKINVNGQEVVSIDEDGYIGFEEEHSKDIGPYLKNGDNVIIFTVRNWGASAHAWNSNKAGFIYYIDIDPNIVGPAIDPYIPPALPSGSISVSSDCEIEVNNNTCNVSLTWTTKNLIAGEGTAVTTNNPNPNTIISSKVSGKNVSYNAYYGNSGLYLYHAESLLDSTFVIATCVSGTTWNGSKCEIVTRGILEGENCKIQKNESNCTTTLSLNVENPIIGKETNVTKPIPNPNTIVIPSSDIKSFPFSKAGIVLRKGLNTFYLNHNSEALVTTNIIASCESGLVWDGNKCIINQGTDPVDLIDPDNGSLNVTLTAVPDKIKIGQQTKLTWSSDEGSACELVNVTDIKSMGIIPSSGNKNDNPNKTTTYQIICNKGSLNDSDTATVTVGSIWSWLEI